MTIRCPRCASPHPSAEQDLGEDGRMVHCEQCGTRWLARRFDNDPYQRPGVALQPFVQQTSEAADAVIIEHIGAGFAKLPPHRRDARVPRTAPASRRALKAIAAILGAIAFLMVFRAPIVSAFPQLASIRGLPAEVELLEFTRVRSETVHMNGVSTLFVEGEIINRAPGPVELPAIRITLKSLSGSWVTSWLVEPSAAGLAAGGSIGFRSALASPPADAMQVTLNLAQRESQTIGLR